MIGNKDLGEQCTSLNAQANVAEKDTVLCALMEYYENTCDQPFVHEHNPVQHKPRKRQSDELLDGNFYRSLLKIQTEQYVEGSSHPVGQFCSACNQPIEDALLDTHSHTMPHLLNVSSGLPPPVHFGIGPANKGYQMLANALNWDQKSGLGKDNQGRLFPVLPTRKYDREGLGGESSKHEERKRRREQLTLKSMSKQEEQSLSLSQESLVKHSMVRKPSHTGKKSAKLKLKKG